MCVHSSSSRENDHCSSDMYSLSSEPLRFALSHRMSCSFSRSTSQIKASVVMTPCIWKLLPCRCFCLVFIFLLVQLGDSWKAFVLLYLTVRGIQRLFVTTVCNSGLLRVTQFCFCSVHCRTEGEIPLQIIVHPFWLSTLQLTLILSVLLCRSPWKSGMTLVTVLWWKWRRAVLVCTGSGFNKGKRRGICHQTVLLWNQQTSSDSYVAFLNSHVAKKVFSGRMKKFLWNFNGSQDSFLR